METRIADIEYYLPAAIVTNEDLEERFHRWPSEKIAKKTGIRRRHVSASDETAADMAFKAADALLQRHDRAAIDFLLLCTQSPDYFLPTSACLLQDRLGLRTNIGALDFNLGCSGFVYGLAMAKGLIASGVARTVLLLTAETYTKHINEKDLANLTIFGDGAAATLITTSVNPGIRAFDLGTDGRGYSNLIIPNGGTRNRFQADAPLIEDDQGNARTDNDIFMSGPDIFNFTIESVPVVLSNVLKKNTLALEEIDYFIFHQANKYMLDYLCKICRIPGVKFFVGMEDSANTVSATIPIALRQCLDQGLVKSGDKVLLVGFGVGYSWGGVVIEI
jgi:3-oxoacyl-[acyl-carrier-protein] synthase-3